MSGRMEPQEGRYEYQEHDYNPEWDYEVQHHLKGHPLAVQAQQRMNYLSSLSETQFSRGHVVPVDLSGDGVVARYVSGTANEPVVVFDPTAHENAHPDEIGRTIDHEVRHAMQEAAGMESDEHDAEHGEQF